MGVFRQPTWVLTLQPLGGLTAFDPFQAVLPQPSGGGGVKAAPLLYCAVEARSLSSPHTKLSLFRPTQLHTGTRGE